MATSRDRLQAHQFLVQRTVSAVVAQETDPEQPPFRRAAVAGFGSVAIAILVLGGFALYGLIVPGGATAWRKGDMVIVEKETGARYVYLGEHLHPVTNHTSALLALGKNAKTTSVSRNSLANTPRGPRIGIPGAPDSLPGKVLGKTWTLCSQPAKNATGADIQESVLMVGDQPSATPLADRALLVSTAGTGDRYLVRGGYRHRIKAADTVAVNLALRAPAPIEISPAVLDVIPVGTPLAPIPLPNAGAPSKVPGVLAGQLLTVRTSGATQHFLAETEQLRPITELQFDIQRAYQPTIAAYGGNQPIGIPLGLVAAGTAAKAPQPDRGPADPPERGPEFAPGTGTGFCLVFEDGTPRLTINAAMPKPDPLTATPKRTPEGTALADRVIVPAGAVAVVEIAQGPAALAGTFCVVTDLGRVHPLGGREVLDILGYSTQPVKVPAGLIARLPEGPGLTHEAAMRRDTL